MTGNLYLRNLKDCTDETRPTYLSSVGMLTWMRAILQQELKKSQFSEGMGHGGAGEGRGKVGNYVSPVCKSKF